MTTPDIVLTLPLTEWAAPFDAGRRDAAIAALEQGQILFLPKLAFTVGNSEVRLLDPAVSAAGRKNVSFDPATGDLGNAALGNEEAAALKAMLVRFARQSTDLVRGLFPLYATTLELGRTSFRPVEIAGREYSPRHDDRRLHVDAFPSRPLHGKRILRLFANIARDGAERAWQVGEPFAQFAARLAPQISPPAPGSAWLMQRTGITKGRRSRYDHVMLKLHDRAKLDAGYRDTAPRHDLRFPPGSVWLCFTDQVLHAALSGHAALEQTFYLPVASLADPASAPLKVLEKILGRNLV
ncbi:MAG: Kdo hydroxylase family protein [Stellaceae bacterium]